MAGKPALAFFAATILLALPLAPAQANDEPDAIAFGAEIGRAHV